MWSQQPGKMVANVDLKRSVRAQGEELYVTTSVGSFIERLHAVTAKSVNLLLLLAET